MYITDDLVSLILQSPSCQSPCFRLTFLGLCQQIPKSSPIRLTTATFGTFIPEVNNNRAHSTTASTCHVNQPNNSVFSDFQEVPRPDDETTGEDRQKSCSDIWTQQCNSSGDRYSDGLCNPAQRHTHPALHLKSGRLHQTGVNHFVSSREPIKTKPIILSIQDTSVSARVFLNGMKVAASLTLNKWVWFFLVIVTFSYIPPLNPKCHKFILINFHRMNLSVQTSYVGEFEVRTAASVASFETTGNNLRNSLKPTPHRSDPSVTSSSWSLSGSWYLQWMVSC